MLRFEEAGEDELLLKLAELKSAQCEGGQLMIVRRSKGVESVAETQSRRCCSDKRWKCYLSMFSLSRYVGRQVEENCCSLLAPTRVVGRGEE